MAYSMTASDAKPADSEQDDLYGESDGGEQEKSVDQEEQETMADTALVPVKILKAGPDDDLKVGDERVVKVMKIHGEEAEVMYAPEKGKGKGESKDNYMESADDELDSMSKE